jgi:hypothetical protein
MFGLSIAGIGFATFAPSGGDAVIAFTTPLETALTRLETKERVVDGTDLDVQRSRRLIVRIRQYKRDLNQIGHDILRA